MQSPLPGMCRTYICSSQSFVSLCRCSWCHVAVKLAGWLSAVLCGSSDMAGDCSPDPQVPTDATTRSSVQCDCGACDFFAARWRPVAFRSLSGCVSTIALFCGLRVLCPGRGWGGGRRGGSSVLASGLCSCCGPCVIRVSYPRVTGSTIL